MTLKPRTDLVRGFFLLKCLLSRPNVVDTYRAKVNNWREGVSSFAVEAVYWDVFQMDLIEITSQFTSVMDVPSEEIDLVRAALLVAATEYPSLNIEYELHSLDALASQVAARVDDEPDPLYKINTLSEYLFDELEFKGSRDDYYDPRNSFLNQVLNRRSGIPISLSLLYIEVGKRLGMPLFGIGMPGHFLVGHSDVPDLFVDSYNKGILITESECAGRLLENGGDSAKWDPKYLSPITSRDFVARLIRNLKGIYIKQETYDKALTMVDWLIRLQPEASYELRDRGIVYYRLGDLDRASTDLKSYLGLGEGVDAKSVQDLLDRIEKAKG